MTPQGYDAKMSQAGKNSHKVGEAILRGTTDHIFRGPLATRDKRFFASFGHGSGQYEKGKIARRLPGTGTGAPLLQGTRKEDRGTLCATVAKAVLVGGESEELLLLVGVGPLNKRGRAR